MISAEGFEKTFKYLGMFRDGLLGTLLLSAFTVVFGFILGLILSIIRISGKNTKNPILKALAGLASAYVEIIRATPMLVQLFIIYYGMSAMFNLPRFEIFGLFRFERFLPGVIALSMNSGAYLCEVIRSGIQSIDYGQTEASRSLGLSAGQTMRYVILPQAIKNILPAIANEFVTIIKESSICYTVGVQEIMYAASSAKGATYLVLEPYLVAAAVYFCLTFPTSKIIAYFERRMSVGDRHEHDN